MTWVLVADSAVARLFQSRGIGRWQLLGEFIHPESRYKGDELVEDRPGRMGERGLSPKDFEATRFARELAELLHKGAVAYPRFRRLVLVGPAEFLGLLREHLTPPVLQRLMGTIERDFTHYSEQELHERLREFVPV